ncbi:hypothetical protein J0X19_09170 [Hymenobacter sp. BT186]|uniref:NTF2 fold domain-containing protein n=1 Tax=Hymenobacter telluris TaxID=2816474 RepID=A0A939EVR5_9BACT|nr:NTF2 fold immunity protein [Hymenobacter telluris]MBO0358112.1 hypothetical protein [Hymenobacter telluris]MBW3374139.1 YbbC/YhhH family protein [Hymenobacter norwichensis]
MKKVNIQLLPVLLLSLSCSVIGCAQSKQEPASGQKAAIELLQAALKDSTLHNVVSSQKMLIGSSTVAVQVAEPILFNIYGKENIQSQRPYTVHLIDNYWVLAGRLPAGYEGGTFLLIMDARNSKVIRITHGK